jgi:collagen triple helix repeat protein
MMRKTALSRRTLVAGATVLAVTVGAGIAYASIPSTNGVINGCYEKRTGILRVIDSDAGKTCLSFETPISWNQQGPKGEAGPAGPAGPKGDAGSRGENGAAGQKGDPGDQGPAGATGADGAAGPIGPAGPKGDVGPRGENGAPGPKGEQGLAGATGAAGPAGPVGPAGPKGDAGQRGPAGPAGPAGPKGDPGERGPAGSGLFASGIVAGLALGQSGRVNVASVHYDADAKAWHVAYATPATSICIPAVNGFGPGSTAALSAFDTDGFDVVVEFLGEFGPRNFTFVVVCP